MTQPTLTTKRLVLRPFDLDDAPAVQRMASAWEIADTTLSVPHPYPDGAAEDWIRLREQSFQSGTGVEFAIVRAADGVLLGTTGMSMVPEHARGEIGYWIGVEHWGQGYASEAAARLLEYGFVERRLNRIQAHHFSRNPASGRVMQKIGMRHEAHIRQFIRKGGVFEDLELYVILREEWAG